jgi:hypothetical protein
MNFILGVCPGEIVQFYKAQQTVGMSIMHGSGWVR